MNYDTFFIRFKNYKNITAICFYNFKIGLEGETETVEERISSTFQLDPVMENFPSDSIEKTKEMKAFITALQRPVLGKTNEPIPEISPDISLDEYGHCLNFSQLFHLLLYYDIVVVVVQGKSVLRTFASNPI